MQSKMSVLVRLAMAALFAVGTCAATAEAGGGSSKQNANVTVVNDTNNRVAVILLEEGEARPLTQEQFIAAGGKVLEPGRSFTYKNVRNGDYTLGAAVVVAAPPEPGDFDEVSVEISNSTSETIEVSDVIE